MVSASCSCKVVEGSCCFCFRNLHGNCTQSETVAGHNDKLFWERASKNEFGFSARRRDNLRCLDHSIYMNECREQRILVLTGP